MSKNGFGAVMSKMYLLQHVKTEVNGTQKNHALTPFNDITASLSTTK